MVALRAWCGTSVLWLVLAGCTTSGADPIIGKWKAGDKIFEFTADETIIAAARSEPECEDDKNALAACARQNQWQRTGSTYRLTFMTLAPARRGGLNGGFGSENDAAGCGCVEDISAEAEITENELVIENGKERAQRVK